MTTTSNDALVGALQEARKNRDGEDMSWIEDLADLPDIPTGKRRVAVMIYKRGSSEPEVSDAEADQDSPSEAEEKAAHSDEPPKKKKKKRKKKRKKKKGKS